MTKTKVVMGEKVADYFSSRENSCSISWKLMGIDSLEYQRKLSDLLSTRIVISSDLEDQLLWSASK